ncbi:MAG: PQQ-binding-like beta-propeller repeat protein [Planctomycetales bacterium]
MWRKPLTAPGLGGVAATDRWVIVADRERNDSIDAFRCFDAHSGAADWTVRYPAPGRLDYGNSSRATPLIDDGRVYLFGAQGHLQCVDLATGEVVWSKNLVDEFDVTAKLPWGLCGSPLLADGKLILNPGGDEGSVVALDPQSGETIWSAAGEPAGYGSLIAAQLGGRWQVVGHDATSLGGWDLADGKRLWTLVPENPNDFNVPTPVVYDGGLIVVTENNGLRQYRFDTQGTILPEPVAHRPDITPDVNSPIVIGDRLFIVFDALYCLDLKHNLATLWEGIDPAYQSTVSLIGSAERLLIANDVGELLLVDPAADEYHLMSRQPIFTDESGLLSHPAIVGSRLYLRGNHELVCVDLEP